MNRVRGLALALVFVLVVAALTIGAATAGLVPTWWSVTMATSIAATGIWLGINWRKTAAALLVAIGLFVVWTVGTLVLIP